MEKTQFAEIRRQAVLKQIVRDGQAAVSDLSRQFGVSEVTVRADLQALAEQGLVLRTHGGAVLPSRLPELSFAIRSSQQVEAKERIGAAGALLVKDGDAIFLDTSSTALAIARRLKQHRDLTVITNSLAVAQAMLDAPNAVTYMPGGALQRDTLSLVGAESLGMLERFNVRAGFFGAHGLSHPEGLTDVSAAEADFKARMLSLCRQVYAVIDHTKWGRAGLASFARLEDVQAVITDQAVSPPLVEKLMELDVEIILA